MFIFICIIFILKWVEESLRQKKIWFSQNNQLLFQFTWLRILFNSDISNTCNFYKNVLLLQLASYYFNWVTNHSNFANLRGKLFYFMFRKFCVENVLRVLPIWCWLAKFYEFQNYIFAYLWKCINFFKKTLFLFTFSCPITFSRVTKFFVNIIS